MTIKLKNPSQVIEDVLSISFGNKYIEVDFVWSSLKPKKILIKRIDYIQE